MDSALPAPRAMDQSLARTPAAPGTLERYFLDRLYRLARVWAFPDLTPRDRRLTSLALYSTYWDCVRLGYRDEARGILGL